MRRLGGLRVCMATSSHPPNDDRIYFKEARSLAKAGADVVVVYPEGKGTPPAEDAVRFSSFRGKGTLRSRLAALRHLEAALRDSDCDVVHCHEPDALVAALRVKRETGAKIIFDSHEMWGAVLAGRFPRPVWGMAERAFKMLERRWLARCDAAIGASWAISQYLTTVLPGGRVATVLNVPVADVFGEGVEKVWGDETILCHDGYLTFDRGLKTLAEAVRLLADRHKVRFRIVGDVFGRERAWLDGFVQRHQLVGVIERTGWLPYAEVGKALAPCHIGLIGFQETPNNVVTSSNKVFNYMLYGIPFVGPDFRLAKQRLVREEGCGVLADPASPQAYAVAIERLIQDREGTQRMAHRALEASRQRYRWEHMEPMLLRLYERVLAG